jgi:hypothetical protein
MAPSGAVFHDADAALKIARCHPWRNGVHIGDPGLAILGQP